MTYGIGGGGYMGVALETTSGIYVPPTKFVPFNTESLGYQQETQYRRPIRKSVDILDAVPGNVHTEGDIEIDAREDVLLYFLQAARTTMTVDNTDPTNLIYTFTPNPAAVPSKTMSITIVRDDQVFGYNGCIVSTFKLSISDGVLVFTPSIIGSDEAEQTAPGSITWPATTPYGAGQYNLKVAGSQIFDSDTFEFTVEDNGTPQYRLKDSGRGAQLVTYGERSVTLTMSRDFQDRADYDAFKAMTAQAIDLTATKSTTNYITVHMPASIKDTYEIALGGQGDLVRSNITYNGLLDANGNTYTIEIGSQETFS